MAGSKITKDAKVVSSATKLRNEFIERPRQNLEQIERMVNKSIDIEDLRTDLASGASGKGAGLVGFSQSSTYSAATLGMKGQQDINPLDAPFLAVGDGVADDTVAVAAASALGPVTITRNHLITSNVTLPNAVEFVGMGKLTILNGITVTFKRQPVAPKRQIFYGAGVVAGLIESWIEWFAGDSATRAPTLPSTNARPAIQKAINALIAGGALRAANGSWAVDGLAMDLSGRSFKGAGFGPDQTVFWWNGTTRNGFHLTSATGVGGYAEGFRFDCLNASIPPVAGTACYTTQSETSFGDIETTGSYIGIHFKDMVIGRGNNIRHNDCLLSPLILEDVLDVFYDKWNHSALGDLTRTSATPVGGAFVAGESVSAVGGSTGVVQAVYTSTIYRIQWFGVRPPISNAITSSGKSGTCASVIVGHQLGSVRFQGNGYNEGNSILSGDSVGGEYGLISAGSGIPGRVAGNAGYNYVSPDALFDVSYGGSSIDCGYGWEISGWFASARNRDTPGLALSNCRRIFGTPRCTNNAGAGIQWDGTSQHIYIMANMDGNCRNFTLPDMAEIRITGSAAYWAINGGLAGFPGLNGGPNPPLALYVSASASEFKVIGLQAPDASITNLSTSPKQTWLSVSGLIDRAPLAPNFPDDAAAAAGGVPLGGKYRTGSIEKQRVA